MKFYNAMPDENLFVDRIFKWIVDILVVIVLAQFFIMFFCEKTKVIGNSMNNVLMNDDTVLIDSFTYRITSPARYDVIVFSKENHGKSTEYIKRIIGLPGDSVYIADGVIYVNDRPLKGMKTSEHIVNPGLAKEKIKLEYNEYFVIGDNINSSEDSRSNTISNVKRDEIKGKVWLVSWPFARIRPVK